MRATSSHLAELGEGSTCLIKGLWAELHSITINEKPQVTFLPHGAPPPLPKRLALQCVTSQATAPLGACSALEGPFTHLELEIHENSYGFGGVSPVVCLCPRKKKKQ